MKPGYKQTEVGVIPEDWEVVRVGDIAQIYGRIGFRGYTKQDIVAEGAGAIALNPSNIDRGALTLEKCTYVSWPKYYESPEIQVEEGDVILVKTGSTVGKSCRVNSLPEKATLNPQMVVFKKLKVSSLLFSYLLITPQFANQLSATVVGGALPTLSQKQVMSYTLALPRCKEEQKAIAISIQDVDEWIAALEKVIEKKRMVKQGAMQELLSGKRRLPGFDGEWEEKRLGEIADLYQPMTISAVHFTDIGFPVYGANGIVGYYNKTNHDRWQVTVTCRGSTCGTVNRTVDRCWITGNAMVLNCDQNDRVDKTFFYYLLSKQDLSDCITGSGQPQIIRKPLASFTVFMPKEFGEQTAIAAVLSDMDAEIEVLEAKLAKARQIKRGMMQALLTGRVRLQVAG